MRYKTEEQPKLLRLDLQCFADESNANSSDGTVNTGEQAGVSTVDESKQAEHMIPKSRFDEVNTKYKDIQAKLDAITSEKLQAEIKSQEEAGEFKQLYETTSQEFSEMRTQFEAVESLNKELTGVIQGLLETKLKSVPEEFHELIPENLSVAQKLAWVDRADQKGMFGGGKIEEPIGGMTNPTQSNVVDDNKLTPLQKMAMAFNTKKK